MSNGTSQTVTNQAAWITSKDTVVTVSSTGRAVALGAGEADIQAFYEGIGGSARITVVSATPPPPPAPAPTAFTVCGTIKEVSGSTVIASATVIVKDTSLTTTTDTAGKYCLSVSSAGRIVLRVTKSGYDLAEQDVNVTGNMTANIEMRKPSPPTPNPTPNPTPGPTPSPGPSPGCCRVCTTGKACGDTCIASNLTCRTAPGCACSIASEDAFTAMPWLNYSPASPVINYSPAPSSSPAVGPSSGPGLATIPSYEVRFERR